METNKEMGINQEKIDLELPKMEVKEMEVKEIKTDLIDLLENLENLEKDKKDLKEKKLPLKLLFLNCQVKLKESQSQKMRISKRNWMILIKKLMLCSKS